ncbi:MAG TPA: trehalase family glycosidase [Verrucomicrobiae bacterium]|nr:trehalase family glycosidase [Verrucomicrobiae bacterium]
MRRIPTTTGIGASCHGGSAAYCVALLYFLLALMPAFSQTVPVMDNLWRLVAREDTDGDHKITIHDHVTPFDLEDQSGATALVVSNVYPLSVLLQDLKQAEDAHQSQIAADTLRLHEDIVDRTHRLIQNVYWDALTRRIDAAHVDEVVPDSKVRSKFDFIYVPGADRQAAAYFEGVEKSAAQQNRSPALKIVLLPTPDKITGAFVRDLDGSHGILSLALETNADGNIRGVPYVVPGGRFNELYCWDSYFITLGLLQDGRTNLARGMADNLLYEVRHYGKVPNANRTYYLTRSQPPFLTSIIRAVYERGAADKTWLASALKTAMTEYQHVWLGPDRLVKIGPYELSRYYGSGNGPCPEVEPGHYDEKIQPWLSQVKTEDSNLPLTPYRFLNEYLYCDDYSDLKADGMTLAEFFKNDRALRESGHDTTHRFADRTTDFVSIDLNTLLYRYETDFADLIQTQFGGSLPGVTGRQASADYWRQQAAKRKAAIMTLMWDPARGYFFDYDFVNHKRSTYISATGLWPLWAKMLDTNNPDEMNDAKRIAAFACEKLEQRAGLSATAKESVESARTHDQRQWDYPYGWAPHQMLAWQGFRNYGFNADASRLAYRWLYCIAKNAHDYNGVIPEKYNVVTGSHDVFVEYGNVGTKFSYIAPEGFGWMNASFEVGLTFLSPNQLADLRTLTPPPETRSK